MGECDGRPNHYALAVGRCDTGAVVDHVTDTVRFEAGAVAVAQ